MSEKTELPTPKKLREARKKGQFARSRLLSGAAVTLAGIAAFVAVLPIATARLRAWTGALFLTQDAPPVEALRGGLTVLAWLAVPPLAASLLAGALVSTSFAGIQLQPSLLSPDLERIDPAAGFKRLFSVRQLGEVARALLVAAVMAWIIWGAVREAGPIVFRSLHLGAVGAFTVLAKLLVPLALKCGAVLVVLGGADYLLARRRQQRDLMMTKDEVKREHKESEGDPQHKGQRKALHRALAQGGPARGVQKATAVVVNPTHIAVALRYAEDECEAPYLVAKGRDEDALAIRTEAKRLGIPIVKDIPLARSLVHYDVGEEIPEELYRAAAAVLKVALESRATDSHPRSGK